MLILNNSLKECVRRIRKECFESHDILITEITSGLKEIEGVTYFEDTKKGQVVFSLPLSSLKTKIIYPEDDKGISFQQLVNHSTSESLNAHSSSFGDIMVALNHNLKHDLFKIPELMSWFYKNIHKNRTRTIITCDRGERLGLSINRNNYMCAHYNSADLSMLDDFEELKLQLDIINKSFATLSKPLKVGNSKVYIRDTMLLAPAGMGSLRALGKLYESEGDYAKVEISKDDVENMTEFFRRDKTKFEAYALQDAVITLKHAIAMEEFNFGIKKLGVPLTLSSLGRNFVFDEWLNTREKHIPYQISGECLMGNSEEVQTPKGLFNTGDVGLHLSYYIGNYKGGRNESFMYGAEDKTE